MAEVNEDNQNGTNLGIIPTENDEIAQNEIKETTLNENEEITQIKNEEITQIKSEEITHIKNEEINPNKNEENDPSNNDAKDQNQTSEDDNQSSVKRPHQESNPEAGDSSPRKKPRNRENNDVEMRCIIPSICAGGIIGPGGNNIKDMRDTFKAKISMPDTDASERIFMATGSIENCAEILLRILPMVNEGRGGRSLKESKSRPPDTLYIRLLIHQSQTGALIGRGGYKIKGLREETGANVSIDTECYFDSTDRLCRISGTSSQVMKCVERILRVAAANPPTGPIFKFDPGFGNNRNFNPNNFRGGFNNRRGFGPPNRGRMGGFGGRRGGRGSGRRGNRGGGFSDDF